MTDRLREIVGGVKQASFELMNCSTERKNAFLLTLANRLEKDVSAILKENRRDLVSARAEQMKPPLIDRLTLDEKRVLSMAEGLRNVASLPDPVGEIIDGMKRPNGLVIERVRVPLGVVAIIYEARPNVTIDSIALGLKSGNALVLRGSHSALNSNRILVNLSRQILQQVDLPENAVALIESEHHLDIQNLLSLRELIDVAIPRGGAGLIRTVVEHSQVPVIETGVGNCHVYIETTADYSMAETIIINSKTQRPSVCNAAETLLIDQSIADNFLPNLLVALTSRGVEIRGCPRTKALVPESRSATEEDWYCEYLDLILSVKVVSNIEEAIRHINHYGSRHSEAIVTNDYSQARRFLREIDAAAVYVNASTRFTDGEQFGLGAEIGISTQKLHARGPMGLRELTANKYLVYGEGQIRQ